MRKPLIEPPDGNFKTSVISDNGPHYHNTGFTLYLAEVWWIYWMIII